MQPLRDGSWLNGAAVSAHDAFYAWSVPGGAQRGIYLSVVRNAVH